MKYNISDSELKSLVKIGQNLKERREEMGFSYKKVSDITRISSLYIKSIENGEYKVFPSLVFVKGFLRNYSQLLDLDPEPFLEKYNQIFDKEDNKAKVNLILPPNEEKSQFHISSSKLTLFITGILIILILSGVFFYFLYYYLYNVNQANQDASLRIKVKNSEISEAVQNDSNSPLTGEVFSLNLRLVSKNTGWIRLNIDNKNEFDIYIDKLRTYRWSAVESFKLTLSKGSIAEVYFNDQLYPIDLDDGNRLVVMNF